MNASIPFISDDEKIDLANSCGKFASMFRIGRQ
jgi:hypothetical protein